MTVVNSEYKDIKEYLRHLSNNGKIRKLGKYFQLISYRIRIGSDDIEIIICDSDDIEYEICLPSFDFKKLKSINRINKIKKFLHEN